MLPTSLWAAGAPSRTGGNTPREVTGLSTPRRAPERIQGARSTSGPPASSGNKASKNSGVRPERAPGAGRPRADNAFVLSSDCSRSEKPGGHAPSASRGSPSVRSLG
eukprot:4476105-Alexandrium_andersonii.AAC.1